MAEFGEIADALRDRSLQIRIGEDISCDGGENNKIFKMEHLNRIINLFPRIKLNVRPNMWVNSVSFPMLSGIGPCNPE